jgi:hypothetical protein
MPTIVQEYFHAGQIKSDAPISARGELQPSHCQSARVAGGSPSTGEAAIEEPARNSIHLNMSMRPRVQGEVALNLGLANMIFHILVTVFFFGLAIILCIFSVMRALSAFSAWEPPVIPGDSAANVPVGRGHEQPHQAGRDMRRWEQKS